MPCRTVGQGLTVASPVSLAGLPSWTADNLKRVTTVYPLGCNIYKKYSKHFLQENNTELRSKMLILTEVNEESAIALALILWKNHDAGYVIFLLTMFLLKRKTSTMD